MIIGLLASTPIYPCSAAAAIASIRRLAAIFALDAAGYSRD
jgi:hypothetical protein